MTIGCIRIRLSLDPLRPSRRPVAALDPTVSDPGDTSRPNARSHGSRPLVHIAIDLPTGASSPFTHCRTVATRSTARLRERMAVRALPLFLCGGGPLDHRL